MSRTRHAHQTGGGPSRAVRRTDGFTLLELLVASTVVAIAGAVAAVCLMAAVRTWENCVRIGAAEESAAALCAALAADGDAMVAGRGFTGAADACRFWILTAAPGPEAVPVLEEVQYAFTGTTGLRRSIDALSGRATDQHFRGPFRTAAFAFGDFAPDGLSWQSAWQSASNAPVALRLSVATDAGPVRVRVFAGEGGP